MTQSSEPTDKLRFGAEPLEKKRVRRRRKPFRKVRRFMRKSIKLPIVAVAIFVVLTVLVVGQLVLLTDAANRLQSSRQNFERVIGSLANKEGTEFTLTDFNRLSSSLHELSRSVDTVQNRVRYLRPLAAFNPNWQAYVGALDVTEQMVGASQSMMSGVEPTLFFLVQGAETEAVVTQISSGERIIELLTIGRERFQQAQQQLAAARTRLDSIDTSLVTPETLLLIEEIDTYYEQLTTTNDMLLDAPDTLTAAFGLDDEVSYLVLAQNSDEIRPSGGFIGTWGWMNVRNGRVTDYDYFPSTRTNPSPPAVDINAVYPIPSWWLRFREPIYAAWDGSWHADFPATAEMAAWYYNVGENPQTPIEGVIAIDLIGFEYLLESLGSVTVPDYNVVVTPENFREVVYDIRAFGEGVRPHKEFLAALYKTVFEEWQSANRDEEVTTALLGATLQALRERHLMLYATDDTIQDAIETLGWGGAQAPALEHDYLMVADANLGNKSNSSIIRQWTYDVEVQEGGSLSSRVSISYDYPDSIASQDPAVDPEYHGELDYGNLLQVFTPANSTPTLGGLEEDVRVIEVVQQQAHAIFVSIFDVEYDTAERVQFAYTTPPLIEELGTYKRYRLLLQKQPGTVDESVSVQLTLPEGAEVVSTSPEVAASYTLEQEILDFRLNLTTDQWIEVIYR